MTMNKILLVLIVASGFLLIFYANNDIFTRKKWFSIFVQTTDDTGSLQADEPARDNQIEPVRAERRGSHSVVHRHFAPNQPVSPSLIHEVHYVPDWNRTEHNIFIIYTKESYILKAKFEQFMRSLLKFSSVPIHMHIISDNTSAAGAEEILRKQTLIYKGTVQFTMYNVTDMKHQLRDLTDAMMPYFSVQGSKYYDALFYLSLGLHRYVHPKMRRGILIDCDVVFRSDVSRLFDEFGRFSVDNIFGLAPELTPVYYHVLYKYRSLNPNTNFGKPYYPTAVSQSHGKYAKKHLKHGYPGLNSGVVLLDFERIRRSKLYESSLRPENIERLYRKYNFKGHLGDQDFYTLLGHEHPSLIYRMDCVWNRQLCTWWKEHGYSDIFDTFFHCEGKVKLYHGNCNTRIPE